MSGFTFLEVLVALLVLSIVTAFAIPAFSTWLPDYRLKAAARELFSHFQQAKIAATKNGSYSTVCFYQPMGSKTYSYVVFVDADNDLEYDPGEKIIVRRLWGAGDQYQGVSFDRSKGGGDGVTFPDNDDGIPAIAFQPSGIPTSNSGGLGMGTAYLRNTKGNEMKVVLSSAGNVRID
ncbi:MAG: GspH/FimT family protein [Deltaproteobacteria bacterium]|nr:GspH/FimT family protein [Deltaproteobacteria bacterium]